MWCGHDETGIWEAGAQGWVPKPELGNQRKFIDNEYLAYWPETQKLYMESVASKTTILYLNKANCESIPVAYPRLPEQQKIAQILSTWDKAIEKLEALITAKQKRKKALMQQLLTGKVPVKLKPEELCQ